MIKFPDFVLQGKPPLEVARPIMSYPQHNSVTLLSALFLLQSSPEIFTKLVRAQTDDDQSSVTYPRFSRTMAIVVVVIMSLFFVMAFIVIYIRHCTGLSSSGAPFNRSRRANAAARGLDPSVIETFPTFTYSEVKEHKLGKGGLECAVCLNEFEEDETLRFIPRCDHVFHPECIDAWLMSHVTCPVCRANLVPQPGDDHVKVPELTQVRHDEIAIEVDNDEINQPQAVSSTRNQTPPRSWSIQRLGSLGFGKFRSDSTGHDNNDGMMVVVQPAANLERFTLRLPEKVRKQMMLRRSKSHIGTSSLPRSRSGEGSNRDGARFYQRINDQRSDGWAFLRRALSMPATRLPPKVVAEAGTEGRGGRTMTMTMSPVKMPSFKCLEPKATDDQTDVALFPAGDRGRIASGVGVPSQSINQP